jgi:hypothetical protein
MSRELGGWLEQHGDHLTIMHASTLKQIFHVLGLTQTEVIGSVLKLYTEKVMQRAEVFESEITFKITKQSHDNS